jgi:hypothetical protein
MLRVDRLFARTLSRRMTVGLSMAEAIFFMDSSSWICVVKICFSKASSCSSFIDEMVGTPAVVTHDTL